MKAFFRSLRWPALIAANALCVCMLSFYRTNAAPGQGQEPFANAVQQRFDMINELKEINGLLREQNALLRSGKLQVVVGDDRNPHAR